MNNDNLTIRDQRNKAVSAKLLKIVAENFFIEDEFEIIRKKRIPGNNHRDMGEPRMIFYYLLKKHSNMSYMEIKTKLFCVTAQNYINQMVLKAEEKLRNKANIEFIYQVQLIERDIIKFISKLNNSFVIRKK